MQVIEPSFEIITPASPQEGIRQLMFIEEMARISHRSEDLQGEDTWRRFIKFVVCDKGDWSVVEHAHSTVKFRVDRGITHELVRHRLFSFTQESTRFVNYKKKGIVEFICPNGLDSFQRMVWGSQIAKAEEVYMQMLESGASPQIARSVLPNALASTIAVTGNLRNWRHLFLMRTTSESHPDMKKVMIPLLAEFKNRIPLLYDDIIPNRKQSEALSDPR